MPNTVRTCHQCDGPLTGRQRSYCSDRCRRTWTRENRTTDPDGYARFIARAVGAIGRRQPADFDNLASLRLVRDALADAVELEVARLRQTDASWSEIGAALGISKQAAQQRYRTAWGLQEARRAAGAPAVDPGPRRRSGVKQPSDPEEIVPQGHLVLDADLASRALDHNSAPAPLATAGGLDTKKGHLMPNSTVHNHDELEDRVAALEATVEVLSRKLNDLGIIADVVAAVSTAESIVARAQGRRFLSVVKP